MLPSEAAAGSIVLAARAREAFGVECFWNVPRLADPEQERRLVIDRLRKYGGRTGWFWAAHIEAAHRAEAASGPEPVPKARADGACGESLAE